MLKKIFTLCLSFGIVSFAMCACSEDSNDNSGSNGKNGKQELCDGSKVYECSTVKGLDGSDVVVSVEKICSNSKWERMETSCSTGKCDETTGKCVEPVKCNNGEKCPDGMSCSVYGICKDNECTDDTACNGKYCVNNLCVQCSEDHLCEEGQVCDKGKCKVNS